MADEEFDVESFNILHTDDDLFKKENDVVNKIISVQRVSLPKNGEDWIIKSDGEIILKLKGTRFSNTEKKFLHSVEGMRFLISEGKAGTDSVSQIKKNMKKKI